MEVAKNDIEKYYNRALNLLQELIRRPSFSREETEVSDFLQNYLQQLGLTPNRVGNNVWISSEIRSDRPSLLLDSHIDTVRPVDSWQRDPFCPEINNNRLYGLGSNDAGASVVSLLETFLHLTRTEQPYNLIFTASCEEEVSGKNGIESLIPHLPPIDFAVVGEPTEMHAAVAEKGLMVLDVTARGKAAHAALYEGENAIYKAITDIELLKNYTFDKESDLLGAVKISVTQINAGKQHNVIPDSCSFVVDVRTNECYSNQAVLDEIKAHLQSKVESRSTRLNSTATPLAHPLVEKVLRMGSVAFGSPTLSNQALMPFSSIKIGPGSSARSHTADEYVGLDEIKKAIRFYIEWLDKTAF